MDEGKLIPKLVGEVEILLAEHELLSQAMEWALENDKYPATDGLNYISGIYDMAEQLLKECRGE